MATSDSRIAKIQASFQTLSHTSAILNSASDELTKAVSVVDESLKRMNIGLTAWVVFQDLAGDEELPYYNRYEIGYSKVGGAWAISIRHTWGNYDSDDQHSEGPWAFNDAGREMRIQSVDYLPEVIQTLAKEAADKAKKIQEKTTEVRELTNAIQNSGSRPSPPPAPPAPANRTSQSPNLLSDKNRGVPLSSLAGVVKREAK